MPNELKHWIEYRNEELEEKINLCDYMNSASKRLVKAYYDMIDHNAERDF